MKIFKGLVEHSISLLFVKEMKIFRLTVITENQKELKKVQKLADWVQEDLNIASVPEIAQKFITSGIIFEVES